MVLPYFQGRGTPDWNATANATFHKINLGHDREDILKALLEGIFVEIDNNMDNLRKYVDITQASIQWWSGKQQNYESNAGRCLWNTIVASKRYRSYGKWGIYDWCCEYGAM